MYREGSYGNGAAMRSPVIGLLGAACPEHLEEWTVTSAVVTHAHVLAIAGAQLVARATAEAASGRPSREILASGLEHCPHVGFRARLAVAEEWLTTERKASPREVAQALGNGVAAVDSCATALYFALQFQEREFLTMQRAIAACGGDVDTIGAMAGAIWGAANGGSALPADSLAALEDRSRIESIATALREKCADLAKERGVS